MAFECSHLMCKHCDSSDYSMNFYKYLHIFKSIIQCLIISALVLNYVDCEQQKEYTNRFAVHLSECDDNCADSIANKHGFVNEGKIGSLDAHYMFTHNRIAKRSADYSHSHHSLLSGDSSVLWVEQQHTKRRVKRDNLNSDYRFVNKPMSDPLFKEMWYLNKGALGGYDMNVDGAWNLGYTGKGIVITILDDGIQPNHPDLAANYDPQASYDINDNDPDPTPQDNGDNKHGTRCAGEVAAEAYNDYCGVGIAFNASIGGVRMLDGTVTDEVEARALSLNPNHVDIYSASWGPEDDGKTVDGPGRLAQRAFVDGIRKGRHGLGSVFVWASGNGGRRLDNCNCDGYTNSIYTLSISSATQNGAKPWYLEECSSTLATTYSSGTPGRDENILTVDQDTSYFRSLERGEKPNTSKLCTRSHTGTSASAPIAAAIVALALEANPSLTWRDLQQLVMLSSRYEPLRHESGWITNGNGRKVSHKFGYGLIDAHAMVKFAENWTPMPTQKICETAVDDREYQIPIEVNRPLEVTLTADACRSTSNEINYLEHVQAKITLKYKPRGNLKISLISPSGTLSHLLFTRPRDTDESAFNNWPFLSVHFWGEPAAGKWKLIVQNDGTRPARSVGHLMSWSLVFLGTYERPASYHLSLNETIRYLPRSTYHSSLKSNECSKKGLIQKLDSKECVTACPTGQWANYETGRCQKCSPDCETCFGPMSDNCLSCNANNFFFGYHCVKQCPDGYYADNKLKECLPCASNCKTCDSSFDRCMSCNTPLVLNINNNTCVALCQLNNGTDCIKCDKWCATCNGIESNQCTSCSEGFTLINGSCTQTQCPSNYFKRLNRNGFECERCHYTCKSCSDAAHTNCLSCVDNYTLTSDGICYTCLSGQFMDVTTKRCESCHSSCASCVGPTANDCTACDAPLFPFERRCIPCCTDNMNDISGLLQELTDCCHCANQNGPCVALNHPRSITIERESITTKAANSDGYIDFIFKRPFYAIAMICATSTLVFGIIFAALSFSKKSSSDDDKRRPKNFHEYRKISTDTEKIAFAVEDLDDEEEDSLYMKT